jgi:hypothetical protein
MNTIYTLSTPDHYQHYIPLFVYGFNRIYPDAEIVVGIQGYADAITKEALKDYQVKYTTPSNYTKGNIVIIQNIYNQHSKEYINSLRFLAAPSVTNDVYITDVDVLPMHKGIIEWCREQARVMQSCYYSPHGCWKRPKRFEGGWRGNKERLNGRFVFLTQKWYEVTAKERQHYMINVDNLYREYDEVMLCRICKMCKLPIAQSKYYPAEYQGIHLGDFKFDNRWTSATKMQKKLHDSAIKQYKYLLQTDKRFNFILDTVRKDDEIKRIIGRLDVLAEGRV